MGRAYWPEDPQTAEWWEILDEEFPADPPELRTAVRGALQRHGMKGLTLDTACKHAFAQHGRNPGLSRWKIQHRVYTVTGHEREFWDETERRKRVRTRRRENQAPTRSMPIENEITREEASAGFGALAAMLDDDVPVDDG